MYIIPREICRDLETALKHEWLVTNGKGSYASSTILCTNTRRQHGLLVACTQPPGSRTVMLAKLDEEIEVGGQLYRLGTNEYPNGVIEPDGFLYLQQVKLDENTVRLDFEAASFKLGKTIWMEPGRDTTYVQYQLADTSRPARLTLLPFCDYRANDALTHGSAEWRFGIRELENGFEVKAHENAVAYRLLAVPDISFTALDLWYWRFQFRTDYERGIESSSDLYLPGLLRARLEPGGSLTLIVTREPEQDIDLNPAAAQQRSRALAASITLPPSDAFTEQVFQTI